MCMKFGTNPGNIPVPPDFGPPQAPFDPSTFPRPQPKKPGRERFKRFLGGFEKGGGLNAFNQQPISSSGAPLPQVMNDIGSGESPILQSLLAKLLLGQPGGPFSGFGGGGF